MSATLEQPNRRERIVRLPDPTPAAAVTAAPAIQAPLDLAAVLERIADQASRQAAVAAAAAVRGSAIGVFQAVATMLALRVLLLLGLVGGFALSWRALDLATNTAIGVVIAYAVLIMIPLVVLERSPKGGRHARVDEG